MSLLLQAATAFLGSGLSVLPVGTDKRPAFSWKTYQARRASEAEAKAWFGSAPAVGIIGGAVSGGLEVLDFDAPEAFPEWKEMVEAHAPGLFDRLPVVRTPSGGYHVYFRSAEAEGNQKLALTAARKVMIETRGEGGYVVAPPSAGYEMVQGKLTRTSFIEPQERRLLLRLAVSLSQYAEERVEERAYAAAGAADGERPGDRFNAEGWPVCRTLLEERGWTLVRRLSSGKEEWRRPGKKEGISATFGHYDGMFYVFSTNAPDFDSERKYSPFSVYGILAHGGDFRRAAQALAVEASPPKPRLGGEASGDGAAGVEGAPAPELDERKRYPYREQDGRIYYVTITKDGTKEFAVCDFTARIRGEITTESEARFYEITGRTVHGRRFRSEIDAESFEEERALKRTIGAAAGGRAAVYAGMTKHLPAAIKLLSADDIAETRRYHRTGWAGGRFLLPGRSPEGVEVVLEGQPYCGAAEDADLEKGQEALAALLETHRPEDNTILVSHLLLAPLARLARLHDHRYALHIHGLSGSLKTSYAQASMCLWGAGFIESASLIKWGDGTTPNALVKLAGQAHDMPFYIDNYKRSTGGGSRDFIGFIHNTLEGGEKRRLNRSSEFRERQDIYCWPYSTGEDVPDTDPASLARLLVVPLSWQRGGHNAALERAQRAAHHLPAVGGAWLDFLESDKGREVAADVREAFASVRQGVSEMLISARPDMVNPQRVASSIALNKLAYEAAMRCDALRPALSKHQEAHGRGLEELAYRMASYGGESREATRYLSALREAMAAGKAVLMLGGAEPTYDERDRMIGWEDAIAQRAYILPRIARQIVDRVLGDEGLGGISNQALYSQLDDLGVLDETGGGKTTVVKKVNGTLHRVLCLKLSALKGGGE